MTLCVLIRRPLSIRKTALMSVDELSVNAELRLSGHGISNGRSLRIFQTKS
jgi:hypothetical protein